MYIYIYTYYIHTLTWNYILPIWIGDGTESGPCWPHVAQALDLILAYFFDSQINVYVDTDIYYIYIFIYIDIFLHFTGRTS